MAATAKKKSFSLDEVARAFIAADGRCESCGENLLWKNQGQTSFPGGWAAIRRLCGRVGVSCVQCMREKTRE